MNNNNPNEDTYKKINEWLAICHSSEDIQEKEKAKTLIVTNMYPVIKYIARTIARRATDPVEDLVQAGFIGLLKAIDKYNPLINDNFRVYAGYLIIGEIKHYIRDKSSAIRVPRYIQELSIRIHNFTKDLNLKEVIALTSDEVASYLEIPVKIADYVITAERRKTTLALEDLNSFNEDSLGFEELIPDTTGEEKAAYEDARITFENAISKLPAKEKYIIELYYNEGLNQGDIAKMLNVSRATMSRKIKLIFDDIAILIANDNNKRNNEKRSKK